jgi:hypothetical protein
MVHNLIKTTAPRTAQLTKVASRFVQPVGVEDRKLIDDYLTTYLFFSGHLVHGWDYCLALLGACNHKVQNTYNKPNY